MKKATFLFTVLLIVFFLLSSSFLNAQVIGIKWNTFLGSTSYDYGYGIALDSSGNIYVTGNSTNTWGSPVNAHSGSGYEDVFVACMDNSGNLLWNTFLGSTTYDYGRAIALDSSSGNIYVTGYSDTTWGSPVKAHSGSGYEDVFVACMDSSGNLLWNTFLGQYQCYAYGRGIALDSSGNIYVTGESNSGSWGESPVNSHSGHYDGFVACMDSSGNLLWHTFLGSIWGDYGYGIALDSSGNIYLTGESNDTWGSPVNAYSGGADAFVACLDSSGNLQWNTFFGSTSSDSAKGLALNSSGNIYVTGLSSATWGSPVNVFSGYSDAFIAGLDSSGNLLWNTFLGGTNFDRGYGIALNSAGNIYVTGWSNATWGSPVNPYSGSYEAFGACLDNSGSLLWNTFLGSAMGDEGNGIALDSLGNIYVTGYSYATWGSPVNAFSDLFDAFVVMINQFTPVPDIKANSVDGPITIAQSDTLQIRVSLSIFGSTANVDYWLAYKGPSGWVHYNNSTKKWEAGLGVTHQGPLMDLNNKKVYQKSGLAPGNYTFYFGVDMVMDGNLTKSELYYDQVKVTVTQ